MNGRERSFAQGAGSGPQPGWAEERRSASLTRFAPYRGVVMTLLCLILIILSYRAAFALRFDFHTPWDQRTLFWITLPPLVLLRIATYVRFGVVRSYWQYFGISDFTNLVRAVTISSAAFIVVLMLWNLPSSVPRSVLLMDWAGAIFLAGGLATARRLLRDGYPVELTAGGRRTLVIGTGAKAERLLREAGDRERLPIQVVGLVDDRRANLGRALHDQPVIGTTKDLPVLTKRLNVEFIVIALDTDKGESVQRAVERCLDSRVPFKTLPSMQELLEGVAHVHQLRNVRIQDLLGRPAVELDLARVAAGVRDRVVLITGAGGSIGSELARQVARFSPGRLILVDQAESDLYFVQMELMKSDPELDIRVMICDVTDQAGISAVFERERPAIVLHAAAYKHVPLLESNVVEAVRNNVFGTLIVAAAAVRAQSEQFLLISTDKAINPSSVMGATKRLAERVIFGLPSLAGVPTVFRAVRFGNVLGSNGSVVPLFERQLAAGGPLTVTHLDVERYFMTIPEAVELVLQSATLPETAGRIVMLDMGEPVRIVDLAERMIRLSGLEPYRDVRIVFTGLRPGEKLKEDLTSVLENTVPTVVKKIRIVETCDNGPIGIEEGLGRLRFQLDLGDVEAIRVLLADLVPECIHPLQQWGTAARTSGSATDRNLERGKHRPQRLAAS